MMEGHFPEYLGIRFVHVGKDVVRAELTVRKEICTMPAAVLHGGALMSLADTLGAVATFINLPPGAGTTTLESKTNFLRAAPNGHRRDDADSPGEKHNGLADQGHG
jgi:uncharacterized protein (TIGR00369 family)